MPRYLLLFTILIYVISPVAAQTSLQVDPNDLYMAGNTRSVGNNCFRLTTARPWEAGSVWYAPQISLRQPFEMEMELMLGCTDEEGADGMVFIFHPDKVPAGYKGEGMGFAGLFPSLGVEIDTYQNYHLGDPGEDHLGVMIHGNVQHYDPAYNLAGPVKLGDLEDCKPHILRINWEPAIKLFTVIMDGQMLVSQQIDLMEQVFYGQDKIYWGVAAATGKKANLHQICFQELTFNEPRLGYSIKRDLLQGQLVDLKPIVFPKGAAQLSAPAKAELDKVLLLLQEYPKHTLQLYLGSNEGGSPQEELQMSEERSRAILDYLQAKGVNPERIKFKVLGSQFAEREINGIKLLRRGNWVRAYFFIPRV